MTSENLNEWNPDIPMPHLKYIIPATKHIVISHYTYGLVQSLRPNKLGMERFHEITQDEMIMAICKYGIDRKLDKLQIVPYIYLARRFKDKKPDERITFIDYATGALDV